jgi:hypothetical protein
MVHLAHLLPQVLLGLLMSSSVHALIDSGVRQGAELSEAKLITQQHEMYKVC